MIERLEDFRNEVKVVVRKVCRVVLRVAGFIFDDCSYDVVEGMKAREFR